MPRPGPRPYECVRRAWHSERHKPLRGSIIQQIFRIVGEAHCEKTKINREWQEKLPMVVLKCEEILYSKANNEAEYLEQGTLWDRVSDAVNTIIRIEEVNETGKLLPPCVEAALTLGCVPVKSSRSQRHCNTRTYLTPRPQDANVIPQRGDGNTVGQHCPISVPASSSFASHNTNLGQTSGIMNDPRPFNLRHERLHSLGAPQLVHLESSNSLTNGLVYPLYYGTDYQLQSKDHLAAINSRKHNYDYSQGILIGRPVSRLIPNPATALMGASNTLVQKETPAEQATNLPCDLSLRLGSLSSMDVDKETNFTSEANNHPLDLSLSNWYSENTGSVAESSIRNNPPIFHDFMEAGHFSIRPERTADSLSSPEKWPEL